MSINEFKRHYIVLTLVTGFIFQLATSCKKPTEPTPPAPPDKPNLTFIKGGDFSFLPEIEEFQTSFYNKDSVAEDALTIFKNAGGNTVRIRLWKDPQTKHSALPEVVALANRARQAGLFVWLDVHYSDWWADPGHQTKPASWNALSYSELLDSVSQYTKHVISHVNPDVVQIGNEINQGFLWPDGHITNESQFHELLHAGLTAAKEAKPEVITMVHFAGVSGAYAYFERIDSLTFDQIGISYYPKWHTKDLTELESELNKLGNRFGRKIVLAELAYPFTLGWNDWTNNIIGSTDEILNEFPPSVSGQSSYLGTMNRMISNTINGFGLCYWAPDWVAFKGPNATDGSPWENQALFNFNHVALPALDSLCQ